MKRPDEWIQYADAKDLTDMKPETLEKLVRDGDIEKKPWYLPPFSVDLLRRRDVRKFTKRHGE